MKRILDTKPSSTVCSSARCAERATFSTWVTGGSWRNLCDLHAGRHLRKNMHLVKLTVEYDKATTNCEVR